MKQPITIGAATVYPIIFDIQYGALQSINCFLYKNGDALYVIDAGIDTPEFSAFFEQQLTTYGFQYTDLTAIIITHHHEDHIGCVNHILNNVTLPVYAHEKSIPRLYFDTHYLNDKLAFFEQLYKQYGCEQFATSRFEKMKQTILMGTHKKINAPIITVKEGDYIGPLQVIEIQGHAVDLIALYDPHTKWCFSSDLLFVSGSSNALIDFDEHKQLLPTVAQQYASLKKIEALDVSMMFPGHKQPFDDHVTHIQRYVKKIQAKTERVISVVEQGHEYAIAIAQQIYGERFQTIFPLVISEIIGYLYYAEQLGKIVVNEKNGVYVFHRVDNMKVMNK